MTKKKKADIAVVGAGIMGLAITYAAARKNLKVVLFDKEPKALGASIRNFGLIWPIGQSSGINFERALISRKKWLKLAKKADFWINENGSLHLAYHQDELGVLEEFNDKANHNGYYCKLLSKEEVLQKSQVVKDEGLLGGLWSSTELTVDPREAIRKIPDWLSANYNVKLRFSTSITDFSLPKIYAGEEIWKVDKLFICNGVDFESLYPDLFLEKGLMKVKLQMMKTVPQPAWNLGPSLCGGLSLRHYESFQHCHSLKSLQDRIERDMPEMNEYGIHVLLAQNNREELIIGDSHEYSHTKDPFNKEKINQLILNYLQSFANIPNPEISYRWNGYYAYRNEKKFFIHSPENNVLIINGLGGSGMTQAFALAEEIFDKQ